MTDKRRFVDRVNSKAARLGFADGFAALSLFFAPRCRPANHEVSIGEIWLSVGDLIQNSMTSWSDTVGQKPVVTPHAGTYAGERSRRARAG